MAFPMAGRYRASVNPTIPPGFEQVYKDLMGYNGTFNVVLSIRSALQRYGKLTDKQWLAVQKCLAPKPQVDSNHILVDKCDIPITIKASAARAIARFHKWPVNPCTLRVTQIKSSNMPKFSLRVKIDWSGNVSACRCCGKTLTDWRSQATGVGPHCVKRTNIPYVKNQADIIRFQQDMEKLCKQLGEVDISIKSWGIATGLSQLRDAARSAVPHVPSIPTLLLEDCLWNEKERKLIAQKMQCAGVNAQTGMIDIFNPKTGNTVRFARHLFDTQTWIFTSINNSSAPIKLIIQ